MTADRPARPHRTSRTSAASSLLAPRFYKTDVAAMERLDLDPVRAEWDGLIDEFRNDENLEHFRRDDARFRAEIKPLSAEVEREFIAFLESSVTAMYSGCALYSDIAAAVQNPDVKAAMKFMARDETRHAVFLNKALSDLHAPVDLQAFRRKKKYTYFRPKFVFYATYLSEKIAYARFITMHRLFEQHPERRFHPIFRWFQSWCHDEFRHGDVFALILRANPELLRGANRLWIRFFLLAVYATMYVRDHERPNMHRAMGLDPDAFAYRVFDITTDISGQIFPLKLNTDDPRFRAGLDRLQRISAAAARARAQGGVVGAVKQAACWLGGAATFGRLYLLPVQDNELPPRVRMAPSW